MTSRSTQAFFADLGIAQTFSRPRTPTDNASAESWMATLKCERLYEADTAELTPDEVEAMIDRFIEYYNNERLHQGIQFVTPQSDTRVDTSQSSRRAGMRRARQIRKMVAYGGAGRSGDGDDFLTGSGQRVWRSPIPLLVLVRAVVQACGKPFEVCVLAVVESDVRAARATPPPVHVQGPFDLRREARAAGYRLIAGVDKVGNAARTGPMVAAAVILHEDFDPTGLRDGKKKSPSSRLAAYQRIRSGAVAIGIEQVSPQEIDLGFHAWHMRLLREPVAALPIEPDFVLVDHYEIPELGLPQKRIAAAGDASVSIAAASIVAKVECDRIMEATDAAYPGYGFLNSKGYPGARGSQHRIALENAGPSDIHRRSIKPVKDWLTKHGQLSLGRSRWRPVPPKRRVTLNLRASSSAAGPPTDGWGGEGIGAEGWLAPAWKAAVILIAAVVGFIVAPDRIVAYLSPRVAPRTRDAIVLLWSIFWFVALSFAFVRLQRRRRP